MNTRNRFLQTLGFGQPDLVPFEPGGGRKSTRARWHAEGLPAEVDDGGAITEYAYRLCGGTRAWPRGGEGFWTNDRMIPAFEEKVLEVKAGSQIVQDWKGNVCEIGKEYTVEYLRNAIDFVTRKWIKCPVENRADWESMKRRYDSEDPARLPADAAALGHRLAARTWPIEIHFSGPFWQMREWLGFENLCMAFYDDPDLVRAMVAFWTDHVDRLLERTFACMVPDMVHLSEDMAYKRFAMISPAMTREFLLPAYRRWGERIRVAGCPLYAMDSDGYIGELIPIWLEAGINVCDPIEVAAGNDIVAFRRDFGKAMAYRGGIDKRAIAKGGDVLAAEIRRVTPVIESGGFIPGCDHAIPADVSWANFVEYVRLLARATGWL